MKLWHLIAVLAIMGAIVLIMGCSEITIERVIVDGCEYVIVRTPMSASITASPSQPDGCYDKHITMEGEDDPITAPE